MKTQNHTAFMRSFLSSLCLRSILGLLALGLMFASRASAADLVFEDDTVITLAGRDYLILADSEATSLDVEDASIVVTVPEGSTFVLTSSNRFTLDNDQNLPFTCTSTLTRLELGAVTSLTITPNPDAVCTRNPGTSGTPSYVTTSTGTVSVTPAQEGTTTLIASDGTKVSLFVPRGAVSLPTTISIERREGLALDRRLPPNATLMPGTLFEYRVSAGIGNTASDPTLLRKLASPAVVSISLPQIPKNPTHFAIYRSDEGDEVWESLPTTYDPSQNIFSAKTLHFTLFALFVLESTEEKESEPTSALTPEQIQSLLNLLVSFKADPSVITDVKRALGNSTEALEIPGIPIGFRFTRNLGSGTIESSVVFLQAQLNSDPETRVAALGPGSPGNETAVFGPLTRAAVVKFQEKYSSEILAPYDLARGTGFVGPTTRAKLNELLEE